MDDSDDTIRLSLGLGFQQSHHLTNTTGPEKKNKKNHQQHHNSSYSFLTLALSQPEPPSHDDDDYTTAAVRRDDDIIKDLNKGKAVVAAAASSVTAVMSEEDEEDYCNTPKKKLRLSKHQISLLENTFQLHPTLNPKDKNDLATQLNLRPRQVEVWFQNRRARIKMKQTEVDRESLKKCCEILREENRRLQKEVTELKSLKLEGAIPIQFQLNIPSSSSSSPAAPTMCPSCEGTGRTPTTLNPNNKITGDSDSPTRSFFSSSTDSNYTPKTRLCENI